MAERVLEKTEITVGALVDKVASKELVLPRMQRRYVWRATRVRDLLDSLYRGYPSGAILVWTPKKAPPTRLMSVEQDGSPMAAAQLLLDGQQRLTSLSAVLREKPLLVRGRRRPIEILFNLDHPETLEEVTEVDEDDPTDTDDDVEATEAVDESLPERLRKLTFVVSNRLLASQPSWVPVSKVMTGSSDAEFLKRAGVRDVDDPAYQKYSDRLKRLRSIRDYRYTVHVLGGDLAYEEVTEIFVRVNSLGVKLRSSDLALAQISARWEEVEDELEKFQAEAEAAGFSLELGVLVRAMVVFASGQSRFNSLAGISVERLKDGWNRAKPALLFAMNFLRENGRVEDETLLSSPFFLIPLASYYERVEGRVSPEDEKLLLEWVLVGSGRGYYSGSSETKLDADLVRLRSAGAVGALVGNLGQQFGRMRFDPADFEGRNAKSGLFSLMFLASRERGASDWRSGVEISLSNRGTSHVLQWHHIFPKALLRKRDHGRREINDIANLAFLGGGTNRRISDSPPENYLPKIIEKRGQGALEAQCIPLDPALWKVDAYPDFLVERRRLLSESVNALLDKLST